jgi:phosphatidylinositol alpha-1,6-mannosyltransferase
MKILFISRAYPPIVGGIENQNWELGKWLGKIAEVKIIANKKGKKFLPFFLPYAIIKSLIIARHYDAILLGDGVLSVVGWKIKLFYNKPVICVVHGLDITFKNFIYQKFWVGFFLKKMDKIIAVGNETLKIALHKGIPENKLIFIPNGVDTDEICEPHSKEELEKLAEINLSGKKAILRVGRYVKHKGVDWFICNVMPKLPENYIFIAAGGVSKNKTPGDENHHPQCLSSAENNNLGDRVRLLTNLNRKDIKILFNTADLIISPNIKVEGSMEGFGINAIEGAACKKVVLASNLEGLKDAIMDGENGFLVESGNASAWIQKINELLADDNFRKEFGEKARLFVVDNFRWDKIAKRYLEEINSLIPKFKISNSK